MSGKCNLPTCSIPNNCGDGWKCTTNTKGGSNCLKWNLNEMTMTGWSDCNFVGCSAQSGSDSAGCTEANGFKCREVYYSDGINTAGDL